MASSVTTADDDEAAEAVLAGLRLLDATWRARAPEYKARGWSRITPEIHATPGYHLVLLSVDEMAEAVEHQVHGPEIRRLGGVVARKGAGYGVGTLWSTQRPGSIVKAADLLKSCGTAICFAVDDWRDGNAVLGDRAHSRGWSPSDLSQDDKGTSWLVVEGKGRLIRWPRVTAEAIVERLAGVEPPQSASEVVSRGQVLDDVLGCYGPPDDGLQPGYVLQCLQTMAPARYGTWSEQRLRDVVGVKTRRYRPEPGGRQVWGWRQPDIVAAFEEEFPVTASD